MSGTQEASARMRDMVSVEFEMAEAIFKRTVLILEKFRLDSILQIPPRSVGNEGEGCGTRSGAGAVRPDEEGAGWPCEAVAGGAGLFVKGVGVLVVVLVALEEGRWEPPAAAAKDTVGVTRVLTLGCAGFAGVAVVFGATVLGFG